MAPKLARILLATLIGVGLGGFMACGDSGPAEQTEQAVEEMGDTASDMGEAAQQTVEEEQEEETQ